MTTQFKYLFSPIKVGRVILRNRIVCTGHNTGMDENDLPSERLVRYYEERAKAGVALMITGSSPVHSTAYSGSGGCTCNFNEDVIPWYRKMAEAAHRHGARMLVQLIHHGRGGTAYLRFERPHWVASVVELENRVEPAHEMDVDEISEIVQAFGKAAKRVNQSGLDGVEVHAAGGLMGQFMSPLTNRRTDRYGGNLDNRLRFAFEVIDTVRASIGEDSLLGMRILGDELVDGGLNQDDMKVIASRLAETGKIDYLSVVGASEINLVGGGMIVPPMYLPLGFSVYLAAGLKEVVDIPILCTGRINDPIQAEKILADGYADMVGMVRALICDPELLKKAREGRLDDIRKCVACNECWRRRKRGTFITCAQNPITGREREWSSISRASVRKRIMVVGGGPAGLEAARVCALRGHEVTLYEQREELGGQILIAAKAPLREEYGDIARYLAQQVKKVGVRVELNTTVTTGVVRVENPDVVIVATGSTPFVPEILGADGENVVNVWDVLEERVDVGHRVVVLDGDKGQQGCSTAEFLADKGKEVEILSRSLFVGADIDAMTWPFPYQRLLEKGVVLSPHTWVKRISDGKVLVYDLLTYAEREREVDTVVLALGGKANNDLYQSLRGQVKELYAIGDCVAPRMVEKAIYEGHRVARAI